MDTWKRSLGTSKKEQGISTPKRKKIVRSKDGIVWYEALFKRSWEFMPERIREGVLYAQASKEKKAEAIKLGYKPYY